MATPLKVSDAMTYSEDELAPLGGAHNVVRAKPVDVRRIVLVMRLQRALGVSPVDGVYGSATNLALEKAMGGGPWPTPQDRLWALGELELPGELETLIVQRWKANDPAQGW
jgi:hypothetical protein